VGVGDSSCVYILQRGVPVLCETRRFLLMFVISAGIKRYYLSTGCADIMHVSYLAHGVQYLFNLKVRGVIHMYALYAAHGTAVVPCFKMTAPKKAAQPWARRFYFSYSTPKGKRHVW